MTGCMNSNTTLPDGTLQEILNQLVPAIADLLKRITHTEASITQLDDHGFHVTSNITFPDNVGEGALVAEIFRYRDSVRLDISIDHNRFFALSDGTPSDRRCFLNDYVASRTLPAESQELPAEFVRSVVAGVTAARDAVHRHNKRCQAPWNEVRVAATVPEPVV